MRTLLLVLLLSVTALGALDWELVLGPDQVPEFSDHRNHLMRRVGGLVCADGAVFAFLNGRAGMYRSDDAGETWQRCGSPLWGRLYSGYSIHPAPDGERFAVFTIQTFGTDADGHQSGFWTGDGWQPFGKPQPPQVEKHDGWTWGQVAWPEAQVLLAKEHHAWIDMWLSRDAGQSWEPIESLRSRNPGVVDAQTFLAGVDHFVTEREPDTRPGIYRSVDQGESWSRVSDFVPTGKNPIVRGERVLWTCAEGLLISEDAGASWQLRPLGDIAYIPWCDAQGERLLVVGGAGIFASADAGQNWQRLGEYFGGGSWDEFGGREYEHDNTNLSFAWDPAAGYLYCAPVGGWVWRAALPAGIWASGE